MSVSIKRWKLREFPPFGFAGELGFTPFHAHLLYNRGIRTREDASLFIEPDERMLNDPRLLPEMNEAVARLRCALADKEHIGVYGDFDADGITGTALLIKALRDLDASVAAYIPDRVDEGHGLNPDAIKHLQACGVSLLITVDCGATSISEVELASELGIDTIITDHHSVLPTLPKSHALINPRHPDSRYPFGELTGVGMAFKLIEALYEDMGLPRPEHLLEFVALGTVADVGALTDENRFIVKRGLEHINRTENHGIRALAANARMKMGSIDTESLSFGIIPRLNVAGRLGSAGISLALLTTESADRAQSLAREIELQNRERQELTRQAVAEAERQLEAKGKLPPILIVKGPNWIPGILGLVAGRLSENYYRPAIAVSLGRQTSRASARSIPEFNIVEALRQNARLFEQHGGHPQAAGFTIPTALLPELERNLERIAAECLDGYDLAPSIDIDCEVQLSAFTPENFDFIQSLAPFGAGNPAPVFLTRAVRVLEARLVGANRQHLKMRLGQREATISAIAFNQGHKVHETRRPIDVVYTVGLDTWGQYPRLQMTVQDMRAAA
jgi:single-stranded-DNA-specific exonuclease